MPELASERARAVGANRALRLGAIQDMSSCHREFRYTPYQGASVSGHVEVDEAGRVPGAPTRSQHLPWQSNRNARQFNVVAGHDPRLDRNILHLIGPHRARVFHFDQFPCAAKLRLEDIGPDDYALANESRFKERSLLGQCSRRFNERAGQVLRVRVDKNPIGNLEASEFSNSVAGLEQAHRPTVENGKLSPMNLKPQAARTVLQGRQLRL